MMSQDRPDSRGRSRDRAILRTLVASGLYQVVFTLSMVVMLPFVARALSPSGFGVLATLTGFVALLSFADLGVGPALTTRVSEMLAVDDYQAARRSVSTACVFAVATGAVIALVGAALAFALPWNQLLGADELPRNTVGQAVAVAAVATGLSIPASLGQRLLYGVQRGATANRWLAVGVVVTAALTVVAAMAGGGLPVLVLTMLVPPSAVALASLVWAVTVAESRLRPTRQAVSREEFGYLRGPSTAFFVIGLTGAIGYQTDVVVVASVIGAREAGVYSVCVRAFGLVTSVLVPALWQLWPAFTEAWRRGELDWLRSRLAWSVALSGGAAAVASVILVAAGPWLIGLWLGEALVPPRGLLVWFAVWTTYSMVSTPVYFLMNATGREGLHAVVATVVAAVNLPLSIVLAREIGLNGPVAASLVVTVLVSGPPGVLFVRSIFATRRGAAWPSRGRDAPSAPDPAA